MMESCIQVINMKYLEYHKICVHLYSSLKPKQQRKNTSSHVHKEDL